MQACSGDMLLDALVACACVTLNAVASALRITLKNARVTAEGDLRLHFKLDTDAAPEQVKKLLERTERYCVVMQTIRNAVPVRVS